jgi:putative transposase
MLDKQKGLIHHSDHGSQYLSIRYTERLAQNGVEASVGVIGSYNAEVIYARGPWRSLEAVEYVTLEWVDWFNHCRVLEPIGHVPPPEFEEEYYRQQSGQAIAASVKPGVVQLASYRVDASNFAP